jgi:hypothetical protein
MSISRMLGAFIVALPMAVQAQEPSQPAVLAVQVADEQPDLEALLWIARPLVVFADTENDPRFRQQMAMLAEDPEVLETRNVVVLVDTDPAANGPLRRELRPRGFGIVLIDTDGSVVQRRPAPTSIRELSRTIDRLPSRRQETGSMRQ